MIYIRLLGKDMWRRYPAMEHRMAVFGIAKVEIRLITNILLQEVGWQNHRFRPDNGGMARAIQQIAKSDANVYSDKYFKSVLRR